MHLAFKAVERIKSDSELKELWDESENPEEWYSAVGDLEVRLKELDLETLFDVILDDMKAEEERAAKDGEPLPQRTEVPVESAASIDEVFMEDVGIRLRELLRESSESEVNDGTQTPGAEFDEELYEQLKPLFSAILVHVQKKRHEES